MSSRDALYVNAEMHMLGKNYFIILYIFFCALGIANSILYVSSVQKVYFTDTELIIYIM